MTSPLDAERFCRCGDHGPLAAGSDGCGRGAAPSRVPQLMARYRDILADVRRVDDQLAERAAQRAKELAAASPPAWALPAKPPRPPATTATAVSIVRRIP